LTVIRSEEKCWFWPSKKYSPYLMSSNYTFVINLEQKKPKTFVRTLSIIGIFFAAIFSKNEGSSYVMLM
jgi:hypothetical protein